MNTRVLMWALLVGALLAAVAVGAFLLMYFVVLANAADATRLFGSLLVPPLLLALLMIAYYLRIAGRSRDAENDGS